MNPRLSHAVLSRAVRAMTCSKMPRKIIREAIKNGNGNLQNDLQEAIKSFLYNRTRRRPMVFVTLKKS